MKVAIGLLLCVSIYLCVAQKRHTAVYDPSNESWSLEEGDHGVAWGTLEETGNQTGWNTLNVVSNPKNVDWQQAFASGFVEGALAQKLIWSSWLNFANGTTYNIPPKAEEFMVNNIEWVRSQVLGQTENQEYWAQVALVLAQYDGIYAGYNQYSPKSQRLDYSQFLVYQLNSEIWDIYAAVENLKKPNPFATSHCSVLVKLTPNGKNLLASHVTWTGFNNMLRLWKHYDLPFHLKSTKSSSVSYSGFPGYIPSGDDYFVTNQNLVVMETTNSVFNMSLYQYVTVETVPYWIRVTVANRMASTGKEWTNYFSLYNSGTYNNQWIVVDNKLFTPGMPLKAGTLWIAEQIPGYVVSADKTDVLRSTGYWASYNIPYFPFVYNISGYPAEYNANGNTYSYSECARAKIFRRDHGKVMDMNSMKRMMRYNEWQTDPLSEQDACRGISARCDLNPPWAKNTLNSYSAFGGIDCKITDNTLSPKLFSEAVSGPTWDSQPPFAWTKQWSPVPHYGQPEVFAFHFEKMQPTF